MLASHVAQRGWRTGTVSACASCLILLLLLGGCEVIDGTDAATAVALLSTEVASAEVGDIAVENPVTGTPPSTIAVETPASLEAPDAPQAPTPEPERISPGADGATFALSSPAFAEGGTIPTIYTCDGQDISPALAWRGTPEGTESFALVCDDPDAPGGTWVHWVIYDIPGSADSLPEAVLSAPVLADGSRQGKNSWSRTGYGGPCPPSGAHRYLFRLYALDTFLGLVPGETDGEGLLDAIAGHVLGEAVLTGEYQR
jgi:Raf kinase inhibitor-like YbhB/YbcL family protein